MIRSVRALGVALLSFGLLAAPALPAASEASEGSRRSEALRRLHRDSAESVVVRSRPGDGQAYFLRGRVPVGKFSRARTVPERARDFWAAYGDLFGIQDPEADLALVETGTDALGMSHARYAQRYRGIPVFGKQMLVHIRDGAVTAANGDFAAGLDLPTEPRIDARRDSSLARSSLAKSELRSLVHDPVLTVFVDPSDGPRLTWKVTVPATRPMGLWQVFVDALTGEVVRSIDDLRHAKDREIHTNGNDADCNELGPPFCTLPGGSSRGEGDAATGDAVIDDAYDNTGIVYDYFSTAHGRDSYDDAGHTLRATVHFGNDFNNAFWCSEGCATAYGSSLGGQMVYGDGDGVVFDPLSQGLDVVAHELTHAITENEVGFVYLDQSGALDESYADIFGAMVDDGDWDLGEDVYTPGTPGDALRSMADPTLYGQPDHMSDLMPLYFTDGGGVHINSGIPNHAAYLVATDPDFGGRADTAEIYYRALTEYMTPSDDFMAHLNALITAAEDLETAGTVDADAVETVIAAHQAVGLANPPTVTSPNGGNKFKGGSTQTVTWTPGDTSGLNFAVQYGRNPGTYAQEFETTSLPSGFATGGDAGWATSTDVSEFGGARSIQSQDIGNGEITWVSVTKTMVAAGDVLFDYKVDSELCDPDCGGDFFVFFIDGVAYGTDAGDTGWVFAGVEDVPAGTHTFTWAYEKDASASEGADAVWIDNVVIPNAIGWTTITAGTAADATSQAWTTPAISSTAYRVRVSVPNVAPWLGDDFSNANFTVDATAPTGVRMTGPAFGLPFQTSTAFRPGWTGTDAHSGMGSYDVRYRRARYTGGFGSYSTFRSATTSTSAAFGGSLGYTYCFDVRARDKVGNLSAFSSDLCTAIPVNNTTFSHSGSWDKRTASGYFMNTYSYNRGVKGATMVLKNVVGKRFSLIATKCAGCGTVKVYRGSTLLKTISLDASSTRKKQVIPVITYGSVRSAATFTIKVATSGDPVRIEGFGVSSA